MPGPLLAPSWLPDQLLLRFQCNGIGYHSLQLSRPGSSLPLYLSITSMLTEFPGRTLSGELPPTSPLAPRSGASGAQVQPSACPLSLCWLPMHSASFPQCTSPGESMLPAVLRLLVYLGSTPAQLNLHLLPRAWVYSFPNGRRLLSILQKENQGSQRHYTCVKPHS